MPSLNVKSLPAVIEVSQDLTPQLKGLGTTSHSKPPTHSSGPSFPVPTEPLFIMTPDGIVHLRIDDNVYIPDVTLDSYHPNSVKIDV